VRAALLIGLAAAGLAAPGCGKKGPPLAPMLRVPGRASDIAARRVGDTVSVTFTIPSANIDETKPADIARIDLYAYTAMDLSDVLNTRRMTLVGSIPVRKPPEPQVTKEGEAGQPPKPAVPPAPPEPGEDQGARVTLTETLTADMLVPMAPDKKPPVPPSTEPVTWFGEPRVAPLLGPVPKPEPHRYYVAYGVSRGGNRGGASPRPAVPLGQPPAAPEQPSLEVTEGGVVLTWIVPPGARLPFQLQAEGDVLKATTWGMESAPALAYLVYRVGADGPVRLTDKPVTGETFTDQAAVFGSEHCYDVRTVAGQGNVAFESAPSPKACVTPADTFPPAAPTSLAYVGYRAGADSPVRLTEKPVADRTFTDQPVAFGEERCYDVRTVTGQGNVAFESAPSPKACVTPADTFPPAAPTSLAAVAGQGVISLIWVGVDAADLAGYVVLRGEVPSADLKPLFDAPIRETTYRDATAKPGVRYVYAVVAVDKASPPNHSARSNTVEETAR
jgi:hypothetical protein